MTEKKYDVKPNFLQLSCADSRYAKESICDKGLLHCMRRLICFELSGFWQAVNVLVSSAKCRNVDSKRINFEKALKYRFQADK